MGLNSICKQDILTLLEPIHILAILYSTIQVFHANMLASPLRMMTHCGLKILKVGMEFSSIMKNFRKNKSCPQASLSLWVQLPLSYMIAKGKCIRLFHHSFHQ